MPTPADPLRHDPTHRPTQIRQAIREALTERHLTQAWLARNVGRSTQHTSLKLSGMAVLYERDVERFLQALDAQLIETPKGPKVVDRQTHVV